MFFIFPFLAEGQSPSASRGTSRSQTLPLLPAPRRAASRPGEARRQPDFGDFAVGLLQQTISMFTSSLTALGNRANALFAQVAAALAFDRVARDAASFGQMAWFGFGAPQAPRPTIFGSPWLQQPQAPHPYSPFMMQSFVNPFAANPWAAFSEGLNIWTNLWLPAAPQRRPNSSAGRAPSPFTATVSAPGGFTWGFSWGA